MTLGITLNTLSPSAPRPTARQPPNPMGLPPQPLPNISTSLRTVVHVAVIPHWDHHDLLTDVHFLFPSNTPSMIQLKGILLHADLNLLYLCLKPFTCFSLTLG